MQSGDAKSGSGTLTAGNFGPKYEQHVSEMQRQLDEASKKYAAPCSLQNGTAILMPRSGHSPSVMAESGSRPTHDSTRVRIGFGGACML